MIGGDQLWRLFFDRGGRTLRLSVRSAAADSGIGAISHEALWRSKSVLRRLPPEVPRRRSGPLSGHGVLRPNDRHGRSAADDRRVWTSAIWNGRPALGRLGWGRNPKFKLRHYPKAGTRFRSGVAGQRPGFVSLTIEDQFLRRLPCHPPCHLSGTCPTMTPPHGMLSAIPWPCICFASVVPSAGPMHPVPARAQHAPARRRASPPPHDRH